MFDKEALKRDADCLIIADQIGVKMKRMGTKYAILCPNHADRHLGSCFLTSSGYRCFSCNHQGDVIDFVEKELDLSFTEACRYIAELCGGEELYTVSDNDSELNVISSELGLPFIPRKYQKFLNIADEPVYVDVDICYYDEIEEHEAKGHIVLYDDIDELISGKYRGDGGILHRVLKKATQSPLYDLYRECPSEYIKIVDNALQEKASDIESFYDNISPFFPKALIDKMYREEIQKVQDLAITYGSRPIFLKDYSFVDELCQAWKSGGGF